MLHQKTFVKKTRKQNVVQVVREHYLRDDIWSGSPLDLECDPSAHKLSATASQYLVIDTNVALHNMDFLEHPAVKDVVVPGVVLEEVKHRNVSSYKRLRNLIDSHDKRFYVFSNEHCRDTFIPRKEDGESENDRNDRAIRKVAKWYMSRIPPSVPIILITNDAGNHNKAVEEGIRSITTKQYAAMHRETPELLDVVAYTPLPEQLEEKSSLREHGSVSKRPRIYDDHLKQSELTAGLKRGLYHQGTLRVNRFNPFEGWVSSESVGRDILIKGRVDMNRAFDGDVVVVELLPESSWQAPEEKLPTKSDDEGWTKGEANGKGVVEAATEAAVFQVAPGEHLGDGPGSTDKPPTGKVVGVIKRNWRTRGYCGSLQPRSDGFLREGATSAVLFQPVDKKFPMIRIVTRQANTLADKRIVVVIDRWSVDSQHPEGHYVRTLGPIGDRETETDVLLLENDINTSPFTPAVHDCVPPLPWSVSEADYRDPTRQDLRHLCICSVDPPGCKDIDDALHVRQLDNGNLEVGVHIADVTHFLRPGTAMDMEASSRATTVYLVQRRIDMLPKPLTEDICSLRGGVERLAFSVLWEMTQDAEIVDVQFTKSIIKSRAAMTYAEAQARIDDERLHDELTMNLRAMNHIAKILRRRRAEAGALQLASPEVKFEIDTETHDPLDVGMYQVRETNQMVEELMLLANIEVAKKIVSHFPTCALLRRHPVPAPRQFEPLLRAAACTGFSLNITDSKSLAQSLDLAVREDDPYFNKLVRIMCTRCMTQAVYFGSGELSPPEYLHYGLASEIYTHFTSPIRRYADVVVHRLLAASLGLEPLPDSLRDRDALRACSDNLNTRHRNAQMAGRASVELHTVIFFHKRVVLADARVTAVKKNGLIVFVPKFGIEGPVYLTSKEEGADDLYLLDEAAQTVEAKDGSVRFAIFDKCAVKIEVQETQGHRRHLVLGLEAREKLAVEDRMG